MLLAKLSHDERFEFPGLGIRSTCPASVYINEEGGCIVLFFQDRSCATGTPIINGFEEAATLLYRHLKWPDPEKLRFFIRVERSQGEPPLGVPETYYDEVFFQVASMKRIEATRFQNTLSLAEGNQLFGLR